MTRRFLAVCAVALASALWSGPASAQSCTGRFVNPISDVCWECLFPISIGPLTIGGTGGVTDTPNPSSPICFCGSPIPRIGLSLGVWEPARLVDVTRTPWCFPNLGGLTIDPGLPAATGPHRVVRRRRGEGLGLARALLHVSAALLDRRAARSRLPGGRKSLDIAWVSELDPAWLDDELSFLLSPEAALFANLPAQAACAADCAAASVGPAAGRAVLVRGLPGRDVSADRQRGGPCGRRAGLAAGGPAPGLPPPPRRSRLGHVGFSAALCGRYPMPVMKKSPIPLADDRAGAGDDARDGLQPDRAVLGALGIASRAAGLRRELRLPAVAEKIMLFASAVKTEKERKMK